MSNEEETPPEVLDRKRIRERREELGWSMDRAGEEAGFAGKRPGARWNQFENGHIPDPQVSNVIRIARALGLAIDDVLLDPPRAARAPRSPRSRPAPRT